MINASIKNLAVDMFLDLLKTYSPPKSERKAIEILKNYAEELEYENVVIDNAGNLIASYGSGNIVIAVIGHIDTIPWQLPAIFDGHRFFGRGAVDAKGPLTAAFIGIALARYLVDIKKVKIYAIAAVDEEGDSDGAKHLIKSGFRADGIVIAEPSNNNGIVLGYRGSTRIRIVCIGPGGHSSSGTENSACEKLISIWQKIKAINTIDRDVYSNTPALLKLCCGEDAPISPRYGEALVSIRIALNSDIELLKRDIEKAFRNIDGCSWSILDYTKPVKVSINNVTARALTRSILENNLKPRILYKYGTSDMNILYPNATMNIAAYGPGKSELAHTDKEEMSLDELVQGIQIYKSFVKEFVSISIQKLRS